MQPCVRGHILDLRLAEWTYLRIAVHIERNASVVCLWIILTGTSGPGLLRSTDLCHD